MGTGCGGISYKHFIEQSKLAYTHFIEFINKLETLDIENKEKKYMLYTWDQITYKPYELSKLVSKQIKEKKELNKGNVDLYDMIMLRKYQ